MPQISIIVPVYKAENYLQRCVTSILSQTFSELELILVDDGSPDGCPALCDQYAEQDSRVRVIHQPNAGVAAARNAGLDVATGEYITFVDSDDYIEPRMYEHMMHTARDYDCELVLCDCLKEFGDHTELYTHDIRPGYYNRAQLETEYFCHLLMMPQVDYPPTISNCLCVFKREVASSYRIRYEVGIKYSEDLLFGAKLIYRARSFFYMKGQAFYHYDCTNAGSATHQADPMLWENFQRLHNCIQRDFGHEEDYDFRQQIDKALLYFVYNAAGRYLGGSKQNRKANAAHIKAILGAPEVREMFCRIKIRRLPIPRGLLAVTFCYKYRVFIGILCAVFGKASTF